MLLQTMHQVRLVQWLKLQSLISADGVPSKAAVFSYRKGLSLISMQSTSRGGFSITSSLLLDYHGTQYVQVQKLVMRKVHVRTFW